MNLEFWQSLNYAFQDIIVLQLCLVAGYAFFAKKYISLNYHPIIYYLIGSVIIELVSKIILRINESSLYFNYVNYFNIPFELIMLSWFLKNIFQENKMVNYWIYLNFSSIVPFLVFLLFIDGSNSKYGSLALSILNVPLLLYCLYPLNKRFKNKKIFRIPEIIFCFSFLIAYTVLIIIFFTLPMLTEFSDILVNQVLIFKHIVNIFFYVLIGYGINKSKNT
jgi:hypothetical protein